jgi:hypothetical protein
MKVALLDPDGATVPVVVADQPPAVADLAQDLQLDVLLDTMSGDDEHVRAVSRAVLLAPPGDGRRVLHRQGVLADALARPDLVQGLYELANRALQLERAVWWVPRGRPEMLLDRHVHVLTDLVDVLEQVRALVLAHEPHVTSAGMRDLVGTVRTELDEDYLEHLRTLLGVLSHRDGLLMSAGLSWDGQVAAPVPRIARKVGRLFPRSVIGGPTSSFVLADRDDSGFRLLGELRDRAVRQVADAADHAVGQVHAFFETLRDQSAFYRGCIALHAALTNAGAPICWPQVGERGTDGWDATGLYDPCLVLKTGRSAVGNDLHADGRRLVVITGANHGGKTTFLRALGAAQLLAGAGLFAPATSMRTSSSPVVLTHWVREEDPTHRHGKLDEELARMSTLVERLEPDALLLSNESFSATNEAEGSQIALDVLQALLDARVRVAAVTHLQGLARALSQDPDRPGVFLSATRQDDGTRTYRLQPGRPGSTGFARDLYDREFGTDRLEGPSAPAAGPEG